MVLNHALRRALDQLHAVFLLLRVLRLARLASPHFQLGVRADDRFVGLARAGMAAFIGMQHRGELEIALADVFVRRCFGEHQHAVWIQVFPLSSLREQRAIRMRSCRRDAPRVESRSCG